MVTVAVDAMGGDYSPTEVIKGALDALKRDKDVKVVLVGQKEALKGKIPDEYSDRCSTAYSTQVIGNDEAPVAAIRSKKDSSIVVGMNLVKEGKADAFVSAGSTGAVLVGGQLIVGRIKGVLRPALAPLLPTEKGVSLLIDCGANVDARSEHLVQFARIGSLYMEKVIGIKNPRVGIVNIGAEEEKGNSLVKETMPLLRKCDDINFTGSVEAREIPKGGADVIVCEAFVGNVILKLYEGVGSTLIGKIKEALTKNVFTKLGALMIKSSLKETLKSFDASRYGGAPLLGLNGLVVKAHGNSKANEISNSILQCKSFKEEALSEIIREKMKSEGD